VGGWASLRWLLLSQNQLASLPEEIGHLSNLEILSLSGNRLSSLPSTIGRLTNLKELYLNENQLVALPDELCALTGLETLYLTRNQLSSLPSALEGLPNLKYLYAGGQGLEPVGEGGPKLMLRVMAEWSSSGIWMIGDYGGFRHAMVNPEQLGVPVELAERFRAWIAAWEAGASLSLPWSERINVAEVPDYNQINEEGRVLARALKQHFGSDARVCFAPETPTGDLAPEEEIFE
jgi:hypothetical protein